MCVYVCVCVETHSTPTGIFQLILLFLCRRSNSARGEKVGSSQVFLMHFQDNAHVHKFLEF